MGTTDITFLVFNSTSPIVLPRLQWIKQRRYSSPDAIHHYIPFFSLFCQLKLKETRDAIFGTTMVTARSEGRERNSGRSKRTNIHVYMPSLQLSYSGWGKKARSLHRACKWEALKSVFQPGVTEHTCHLYLWTFDRGSRIVGQLELYSNPLSWKKNKKQSISLISCICKYSVAKRNKGKKLRECFLFPLRSLRWVYQRDIFTHISFYHY